MHARLTHSRHRNTTVLLAASMAALASHQANAASISWAPAFEIVSTADLKLTGRQVTYALNAGDTVGNTAVQPASPTYGPGLAITSGPRNINFSSVGVVYGQASVFKADSFGDITTHRFGQNYPVTFDLVSERGTLIPNGSFDTSHAPSLALPQTYATPTGNTNLDSLLNSQIWSDGRVANTSILKISLNTLTPGTAYQVQLIANADSRDPRVNGTLERNRSVHTVRDLAGNSVSNFASFRDLDADGVRHVTSVTGTFTADAASQRLDVVLATGRNPGVSAVIVTQAPSTWANDASDDWNPSASWQNGAPNAAPAYARFANNNSVARTATLTADQTTGVLEFASAVPYTVAATGTSSLILAAGPYASAASVIVSAGTHEITAPVTLAAPTDVSVATGTLLRTSRLTGTTSPLTVSGGGTLAVTSGLIAKSLSIATDTSGTPTSLVDLADGGALLTATTEASVRALVRAWYNNGTRTGLGLGSSLATTDSLTTLAVVTAGTAHPSFLGQATSPTHVIVTRAYLGDTDLSGSVTSEDLTNLIRGIRNNLTGWANGDTNYDGVINGLDYANLLTTLRNQGTPLAPLDSTSTGASPTSAGVIPEPAHLSLLLTALPLTLRKRRLN